jgi:effector-binding domain-containing protein
VHAQRTRCAIALSGGAPHDGFGAMSEHGTRVARFTRGGLPMTATIQLRTVPARNALVVHAHAPMTAIGATVGPIFGEVASWAGAHGVALAGPAVTRYSNLCGGECDIDAGFIVAGAPTATDPRVRAMDLGGCIAAFATHIGSYESLHETYDAIEKWMGKNGYVTAGPMWEEYFSPPGTPPEQTRTDVYWPVRRR